MPFAAVNVPSIGVSLLQSALNKTGISVKIHYFNLELADRIGLHLYDKLSDFNRSAMMGELIFSFFAFGSRLRQNKNVQTAVRQLLKKELSTTQLDKIIRQAVAVHELLPEYLEYCTRTVLRDKPKLVGFSSVYEQNCGSLSLAKLIKEQSNVPIIFGGANCEGEMGSALLKCAPWVDYICSGEGDIAFVEFIKSFLRDNLNPRQKINGIITRDSNDFDVALTSPVMEMDSLPFPNYDDYFEALKHTHFKRNIDPLLLVLETSRGCWWGEKFQCTFCGLNGQTMKYRSKSIPRVLDELKFLTSKYKIRKFFVVDNILDLKYINGLFPEIKRQGLKISLFYETKSNLSKEQLTVMKRGGVDEIQPGIESLSDRILNIMKKGATGLQNIQLLKWCRQLEIEPSWNVLWGFPDEPNEEYEHMTKVVPLLVHLNPPMGYGKITMDRFSPYFMEPSKYGLKNVRPIKAYNYIYPLPEKELQRIAYHFTFDYSDDRDPSTYTNELKQELTNWGKLWQNDSQCSSPPLLAMMHQRRQIVIKDTRPCSAKNTHILENEEAEIYELCESVHSIYPILIEIQEKYPLLTEEQLRGKLSDLVDKKIMLCDHDKSYLSLAVPVKQR